MITEATRSGELSRLAAIAADAGTLAGRGRPAGFGCVVGGPGRIVHQGVRMGDQFFLRRDKWLWFKDGEQEWQDLPTGCFVDESPFDNTSEDQASWLAAHGPTSPADPAKCEGVLLNLAGEVTLPGGAHARVNRPGRRPLAVDLTTTYYDAAGFTAEAPYKAILVEAWPHYVPAAPTTVYIRGWYGEEFDEGDEIDTSNIVFEKDGVQISPTTAEIVYDDPANRSIVQAIRCEVDFTEPEGEDYTGFWDVLVKCGEVQGPSSFFLLSCAAKVISMDIEVYNGQGGTDPVPEEDEVAVGAFTVANLNDTNANGDPDAEETFLVSGEKDLFKLVLKQPKPEGEKGTVTLSITGDGTKALVWKDREKILGEEANRDFDTQTTEWPVELWVEGLEVSGSLRDIEIKVSHHGVVMDEARATFVWADAPSFRNGQCAALSPDLDEGSVHTILAASGGSLGMHMVPASGIAPVRFYNNVEIGFTVYPSGIGAEPGVAFDISRRASGQGVDILDGTRTVLPGVPFPSGDELPNDDGKSDDEDVVPKNNRIYVLDRPGPEVTAPVSLHTSVRLFRERHFEEFIRVRFDGTRPSGNGVDGSRCSPKVPWFANDDVMKYAGRFNFFVSSSSSGTGHPPFSPLP